MGSLTIAAAGVVVFVVIESLFWAGAAKLGIDL
jgi:hypothetical protein